MKGSLLGVGSLSIVAIVGGRSSVCIVLEEVLEKSDRVVKISRGRRSEFRRESFRDRIAVESYDRTVSNRTERAEIETDFDKSNPSRREIRRY